MRVPFNTVFQINPNGSVSPKGTVTLGGVTMSSGVSFTKGVSFAGVDIASIAGQDLEIEKNGEITVIKAVYQ